MSCHFALRCWRAVGMLGLFLLFLLPAFTQAAPPFASLASATPAASAQGARGVDEYRLGPGDLVRVQVFQNPELTVEARVSEAGSIGYPLVGQVQLGGLGLVEAQQRVAEALRQGRFLKAPQVTVHLVQARGHQVAVLGQVARPGRFALETTGMRASELLAAAGGITPQGEEVLVVSGQRAGKHFRQVIDLPALFTGAAADQDLVLMGGDTLFVPRAPVFYIYGEAQRPGPYRIERGMTLMQALAAGGGPTPRGSASRLRLTRKSPEGVTVLSGPDLTEPVQPDDVIYVRESLF
jgi:polysaccharide export outer membrane protein